MLVYTRCSDFFQRAGRNQGRSRVARDFIAPVFALLAGLLAVHDFGEDSGDEQNILEALTLGSNFASTTLDVHDRHFLFGADNVDSVREMTLNALSVHRLAVMDRDLGSVYDTIEHLVDNQTICSPPHILRLARQAIANSQPQTVDARGPQTSPGDRERIIITDTGALSVGEDDDEPVDRSTTDGDSAAGRGRIGVRIPR